MSDKNVDEYQELTLRPERLHSDLEQHLLDQPFGLCLDHPLVQQLSIDPDHAAFVNRAYRQKCVDLDKARKQRDWSSVVFLHERSHRFDALMEILGNITSARAYWELLRAVWTNSENVARHDEEWFWLWNDTRPCKRFAMVADERKAFKSLPDELTIYRGIEEIGNANGLSWTLDRNKAIWFARRPGNKTSPVLLTARAKKSAAHALLLCRNESEIVIDQFELVATEHVTAYEDDPRKHQSS